MSQPLMIRLDQMVSMFNDVLPDLHVSADDLRKPTEDRLHQIYQALLIEFWFSEDIAQPTQLLLNCDAANAIHNQFPDLFKDVVPTLRLLAALQFFFRSIKYGSQQFGLMDLVDPEPKRTRQFLGIMLNFWSFCSQRFDEQKAVMDGVLRQEQDVHKLKRDTADGQARIDELRKDNALGDMERRDLEAKTHEMVARMQEVLQESTDVQTDTEGLKERLKQQASDSEDVLRRVSEAEGRKRALEAMIKSEDTKANLEAEVQHLGNLLNTKGQNVDALLKKKKDSDTVVSDLGELLNQLQALVEREEKNNARETGQKTDERKLKLTRSNLDDVKASLAVQKQKFDELQNQQSVHAAKWKKKKEAMEGILKSLESEYSDTKKGLSQEEKEARDCKNRIERARLDQEDLKKAMEEEDAAVKNEYCKLLEDVKREFSKIAKDMSLIREFYEAE